MHAYRLLVSSSNGLAAGILSQSRLPIRGFYQEFAAKRQLHALQLVTEPELWITFRNLEFESFRIQISTVISSPAFRTPAAHLACPLHRCKRFDGFRRAMGTAPEADGADAGIMHRRQVFEEIAGACFCCGCWCCCCCC